MTKMIFGALVAAIAIAVAGVAVAGPPDLGKSRKQRPAKLKVARVSATLSVGPGQVTDIVGVPCPRRHRVVSGSISPGGMIVAVDAPYPGREAWAAAVGNPTNERAEWLVDVVCVRAGNRFMQVRRGGQFTASKADLEQLRRAAKARLR